MKKIIMLFWVALAALLAVSCTPDKADELNGSAVPKASELDIDIQVDQTTNYVTFALKNKGAIPMWMFSNTDIVTSNPYQRRFRKAGTYQIEIKAYNHNGVSDGSVIREFTLDNNYSASNPLYGESSKAWVIDASTAGHFGCGPSVESPTEWFAAAPNEKANSGLYENVLTFNSDGTYKFEGGKGGQVFVNGGVTLIGGNTTGKDFSMPWEDYTSTYEYGETMLSFPQQASPKYTVVGYVPNDAYLTGSKLELAIKSLSDDKMELVWYSATANGGGPIAWYMRYVPRDGAPEKDPLFGSGSKTWKIASSVAGHLGCGAGVGNPTEWYTAAPDDKAKYGIYDDRVTFKEDGTYVYNPGPDAKTFVNAGCTVFPAKSPNKEDYDIDNVEQTATYSVNNDYTQMTLPPHTFLPYISSDNMYNNPTLVIKELTTNKLVLVYVDTAIAWQMILIPEDATTGDDDKFDTGAELEASEYKDYLAGSWTWESTTFGHFGCGSTIGNPLDYWPGPAGAKNGCSMYDDIMTFDDKGSYTFDPVDGMTYMNEKVTNYTGGEKFDQPMKDDFRITAQKVTTTYTYAATTDAGFPAFTLPENVLFSYLANNDQLSAFRTYYITKMWENCVEITWYTPTGNGGGAIGWKYRLKRVN